MKCGGCGRLIEKIPEGRICCPHCGFRILFKSRPTVTRKVRAK